jgi:protein-L-isoaspartate(D-aspartate) O-methyltransferase
VPREAFLPPELGEFAYEDTPLPIEEGQTISQPFVVATMAQAARIRPGDRVLEVGTGSGYQAAVLAEIVDTVYSVEIIPELFDGARTRLSSLGYTNVVTRRADGYGGWEEAAPFDAIIVTAAADHIPPPLVQQLKDGGVMVIPVGSPFLVQSLLRVEKHGERVQTKNLMPVRFVPLTRGD